MTPTDVKEMTDRFKSAIVVYDDDHLVKDRARIKISGRDIIHVCYFTVDDVEDVEHKINTLKREIELDEDFGIGTPSYSLEYKFIDDPDKLSVIIEAMFGDKT